MRVESQKPSKPVSRFRLVSPVSAFMRRCGAISPAILRQTPPRVKLYFQAVFFEPLFSVAYKYTGARPRRP
jgi:hypothetical protein